MTDRPAASTDDAIAADLLAADRLAADWATIWRSEWAAIAVDTEVRETWQRMMAAWAVQPGADPQSPTPDDAAARPARPVPPSRASAAADAPDARDAVIAGLLDRVAELERRAATEPGASPAADPAQR